MRWKRPLVFLLLTLGTLCWAQRGPRRDYNDRSQRASRSRGQRASSREEFGDYGSSRNGNDYNYEGNSYDAPQRNTGSDRDYDNYDDSRGRNNANQMSDYDNEEGGGNNYNRRRRQPDQRNNGYSNGRPPPRISNLGSGEANHDDFADYNLGGTFDAGPEGRQGILPQRGRGPRGPRGRRTDPPQLNGPPRQGSTPNGGFDSFDNFGNNQPSPAPFRHQENAFNEPNPGFGNEFGGPRRGFRGDEFDNRPPPVNNRGPDVRFRQGNEFGRPPFDGPGRPHPLIERGPSSAGGYGRRPVQEFLGGDNGISSSVMAELEQFGLGGLIGPAPSPSRPAARSAPQPAPVPVAAIVPIQDIQARQAPIQQIQHAVAGIEARQASIQAVLSSDEKSAKINSNVKAVSTENNNSTEVTGNGDSETTKTATQKEPNKVARNIQVLNATEVLGAAAITHVVSTTITNAPEAANATAPPFILTTTGLPVSEKHINITSTKFEFRTTTTQEPDVDEMTTIPVTLQPDYKKRIGYKKRSSLLVSKVPKRKVSPEYKFLKVFHSVYRGYVKKGGREACSMCSIEYCLTTCSRTLKVACSGVDYNFETKTCTVHSKEEACSKLVPEGRTTHYVHVPCEQKDSSQPLVVSKADKVALIKTTPSSVDDPKDDFKIDITDDVTDDEEAEEDVSPTGVSQKDAPPVGKIESKEAVLEPSETKADDFNFVDEKII